MSQVITKEFTLAGMLGTISGYALVHRAMDEIQELIEWVTGQAVFSHQIPYVMPDVKRALLKQFPVLNLEKNNELADDIERLVRCLRSRDESNEKLTWGKLIRRYGTQFDVAPMQSFDEFKPPPLITPNIEGKALFVVSNQGEEFPDSLDV